MNDIRSPIRPHRSHASLALVAVTSLLLAHAAFAGTRAPASAGAGPTVASLQKQIKALQAQVKALKKDSSDQWGAIGASFDSQNCLGAQVADVIQGTWGVIDQIALSQQKTYFGQQNQVPDYDTCENFVQPTVPRPGIVVPPTINPLLPLLQWIHG